jgi:hypothetical protein
MSLSEQELNTIEARAVLLDAGLVAHARADVPALVSEVRHLRAALADLVWITNRDGVVLCDYCGQARELEPGRDGCPCRLLRATLGAGMDRGEGG